MTYAYMCIITTTQNAYCITVVMKPLSAEAQAWTWSTYSGWGWEEAGWPPPSLAGCNPSHGLSAHSVSGTRRVTSHTLALSLTELPVAGSISLFYR